MVAHIIHDFSRADRMENILKQAEEQIIVILLCPAYTKEATPVIGCAKSHKAVVRFAQSEKYPMVLIMEDDVEFTAPGAFKHFLLNIPMGEFDIYTAGVYGDVKVKFGHKSNSEQGFDIIIDRISGTHCYIVHSRFYDKFLTLPDNEHLDQSISAAADTIYMCHPMAALQMPGYSDIAKAVVNYNNDRFVKFPTFQP